MKLVMLLHKQLLIPIRLLNVQITRSGMSAVTAAAIFTAVQAKNVCGHLVVLPDAILAANVQVEWSQVQTTLIYA